MTIILLAGQVAAGKTTIARVLEAQTGGTHIRVRRLIQEATSSKNERRSLQEAGIELDRTTDGRWLLRALVGEADSGQSRPLIVDAVRNRRQTLPVLEDVRASRLVYLEASDETRRLRYAKAAATDPIKSRASLEAAMDHLTETDVVTLKPLAHLVVETDRLTIRETVETVIAGLGAK